MKNEVLLFARFFVYKQIRKLSKHIQTFTKRNLDLSTKHTQSMANSNLFLKSGFIRPPLQNGLGRYIGQLQRITLKFCKNNGSSKGVRDFIENDLVDFAKTNPSVVVYVKPRRHRTPVVVAEFCKSNSLLFIQFCNKA